ELLAGDSPELVRRGAVPCHEVVDVRRGRVASRARVAQEDALACATEGERTGEAGGATPHDDDVVERIGCHGADVAPGAARLEGAVFDWIGEVFDRGRGAPH